MSFVEDDRGRVGKDAGVGRAIGLQLDGEVCEKEMMVHDDDVALHRAAAHFRNEAALKLAALLAGAGIGARVQLVPEQARLGEFGQFGAVARGRMFLPCRNGAVLLNFFQAAEDWLICQVVEFFPAQVIVAALHVADGERAGALARLDSLDSLSGRRYVVRGERLFQEGEIFVEELLLQIFCAGRDDDSFPGADDRD